MCMCGRLFVENAYIQHETSRIRQWKATGLHKNLLINLCLPFLPSCEVL